MILHLVLHVLKYVPILFAAGFATSYAEKRFQYSLFDTVTGLFRKKKS